MLRIPQATISPNYTFTPIIKYRKFCVLFVLGNANNIEENYFLETL